MRNLLLKNLVMVLGLIFVLCVVNYGCGGGDGKKEKTKFATIGTGGMTGVYYPTGQAIAQMVNKKFDAYNIKAQAESTGGSVFNINAVMNKDLDFGIAQLDRQYQAYNGLAQWEKSGPQKNLRSVFAIYPETVTLIASENSNIKELKDLKGKRVNIGNIGSGTLQNAKDLLEASSLKEEDITVEKVKPVESPGLLQDERLDAFFYTVGHPNSNIKEATSGRIKVRIVPVKGPGIDELLEKRPYYSKSIIPKEAYPNSLNKGDVESIGVKATLITSKDVSEDIVYAITKEVFENFEKFKSLHPAYKHLTKESMVKGLAAPIHNGAKKYYKEAGLDYESGKQ